MYVKAGLEKEKAAVLVAVAGLSDGTKVVLKVPDLFLHGHDTLFVTSLVCLGAGGVLGSLWSGGGARRALASVLFAALTVQGLYLRWRSIAVQLSP